MAKISITKEETSNLFDGILAGDGDIYGRMVNAADCEPMYPPFIKEFVPLLYDSLDANSELFGEGRSLADSFLRSHSFKESPPEQ